MSSCTAGRQVPPHTQELSHSRAWPTTPSWCVLPKPSAIAFSAISILAHSSSPPSTLPPCSALQDNFFSYFSGSVDATTWNLPSPLAHTLFSTQTHSCPLAGEPDPDPSSHFYELDQLIPLLWNITPLPLTGSRSPHPPPPRCKLGSPPGWGKLPS